MLLKRSGEKKMLRKKIYAGRTAGFLMMIKETTNEG